MSIRNPGEILNNRYEVVNCLGQGAMGAVYLVRDQLLTGAAWALKELDAPLLLDAERDMTVQLFRREAEILAELDHPGLPRVVDYFEEPSAQGMRYYFAMEFLPGQPVDELLTALGRALTPVEAIPIALQATHVLEYLHRRSPPVIFRDLKPSNLILTPEGKVYFIDFGIARHHNPQSAKDTQDLGTPGFCAPEQYGHGQTTPRSDVYALGTTLFHLLTRADPQAYNFKFPPLKDFFEPVPPALEKAVTRCLQLKPEDRYPDAASLRADLEQALREVPPTAPKATQTLNEALTCLARHPRLHPSSQRAQVWAFWKDWMLRTFVQRPGPPRAAVRRTLP
ncbi:MAG: serine/threonine-protein kinase [Candidatus Eremiobacterota bacterium]